MTPDPVLPVGRDRPFPWRCTRCQAKDVFPQVTDFTTEIKHDGRSYTVRIPDLAIPNCRKCGERAFTPGVDDQIVAALRAQLSLLTPAEILDRRRHHGLSQQALAEQLGVAKETISRWETGAIQSRAMDNLLRLFFDSAEARDLLRKGAEARGGAAV